MPPVISVEHLSKIYHLGLIGTGTFSRDLEVWWAKMRGKPNPMLKIGETDHGNRDGEELWALRDVSFTVEQGEALGIIGRNGAGKSTLLKILSRVTAPTNGRVKVKGRIASLLEVGTGFHPELTGRENITLNGAILGMSKAEISRKFDEIVDFSGVEKFIDTPVKRYSSGMYVRLAFAVAAHLDPEILVIDEVLAVGDAEFQKKCLGKMGDVAKEGRTVLFVSHNMPAIQSLCNRSILLESGRVAQDGQTSEVVSHYLNSDFQADRQKRADHLIRFSEPRNINRIVYFRIDTPLRHDVLMMQSGMDIDLVFGCQGDGRNDDMMVAWVMSNSVGQQLLLQHNKLEGTKLRTSEGLSEVICHVAPLPLPAGNYRIYVQLWVGGDLVDETNTEMFSVEVGDFFGAGSTIESRNALFLIRATWFQYLATVAGVKQ